jgi:beta-phosphoglucomutase-like phosphatase (HAD superfamily)
MQAALAETPKQDLEATRRWWEERISARRPSALESLDPIDGLGELLEGLFARMSRDRQYIVTMGGAFPTALSAELIDRTLERAGIYGDLADLARIAIDVMDASHLKASAPEPRDGDHRT